MCPRSSRLTAKTHLHVITLRFLATLRGCSSHVLCPLSDSSSASMAARHLSQCLLARACLYVVGIKMSVMVITLPTT
ncbi:hypothetical protein PF007_g14679 [Phytophthora fragariae]|uniref:Uncharacterized protein n=1 Tax=Phytophthora fragariae TaxID=53985 RepID=A0A6A3RS79_9STRA|nr:hypothetical protein PF009_g15719 [Phytophthora fragariae]KAE9102680.1 hypothetical protein PF007_g14679 [Phytophthora fragariae]